MVKLFLTLFSLSMTVAGASNTFAAPQVQNPAAAGTPERRELEYKAAFHYKDQTPPDLGKMLNRSLERALLTQPLAVPKLLGRPYRLSRGFTPFAFEDTYFDTRDWQVLKSAAAYRLRYRWSRSDHYPRYQLLPFLSMFQPSRVEIQAKTGYSHQAEFFTVKETRFEFRNESPPFQKHRDAPIAPWPWDEFSDYAKSGRYKSYEILPMLALQQHLAMKTKPNLKPALKVHTTRVRNHLRLTHPFYSGPNPDQVFILSLDFSRAHCLPQHPICQMQQQNLSAQVIEFELEIDRNTLTQLDFYRNLDHSANSPAEFQELATTAQNIYTALLHDQKRLFISLSNDLAERLGAMQAMPDYKYRRLARGIFSTQL